MSFRPTHATASAAGTAASASSPLSMSSSRTTRAAAGADRQAHGHLALALGAARQEQAGDVRARDEQHETRRRLPHRQDRPEPDVHHAVAERVDAHLASAVGVGMLARSRSPMAAICAFASSSVRPGARRPMAVR